jgi:predicted dinucleotide-binding enzyme
VANAGADASQGTFADAAAFGELAFNCTSGGASVAAPRSAGSEKLDGKVLVDVANALAFTEGQQFPSGLLVDTTESLAEQIQQAFPNARVVKTLNTMNFELMVEPSKLGGEHDVFVCGNDAAAKEDVKGLLRSFGWESDRIIDLGDITGARGTELYVVLWLRLYGTFGTPMVNVRVVH